MTSSLIVGIVFLILALCVFANVVRELTSKHFDVDYTQRQTVVATATWGIGVCALVVYVIQLMLLS